MESCEIVDTRKRLLQVFYSYEGSIVTVPELHDEIVICQGYPYSGQDGSCETFDGENSVQISNTKAEHNHACMALVNNQATIIAGTSTATVETLAFRYFYNSMKKTLIKIKADGHQNQIILLGLQMDIFITMHASRSMMESSQLVDMMDQHI